MHYVDPRVSFLLFSHLKIINISLNRHILGTPLDSFVSIGKSPSLPHRSPRMLFRVEKWHEVSLIGWFALKLVAKNLHISQWKFL